MAQPRDKHAESRRESATRRAFRPKQRTSKPEPREHQPREPAGAALVPNSPTSERLFDRLVETISGHPAEKYDKSELVRILAKLGLEAPVTQKGKQRYSPRARSLLKTKKAAGKPLPGKQPARQSYVPHIRRGRRGFTAYLVEEDAESFRAIAAADDKGVTEYLESLVAKDLEVNAAKIEIGKRKLAEQRPKRYRSRAALDLEEQNRRLREQLRKLGATPQ